MQNRSGSLGVNFLARFFSRPRLDGVLSVTEFERAFNTEIARSERSDRPFSLLVYSPREDGDAEISELCKILARRVRTYDVFGLFDVRRVGVLLPYTDGENALLFADEINERLAALDLAFDCEVFTSPGDVPAKQRSPFKQQKHDDSDGPDADAGAGGDGRRKGRLVEWPVSTGSSNDKRIANLRMASAHRSVRDVWEHLVQPMPLGKRLFDIAVASVCIFFCLPLFAVIAAAIKLTSPGPVIFRQQRAGIGGKPFTFYKFRSMFVDAEERKAALLVHNEVGGPAFKMKNDPRMTSVGRLLRKWSLDELPQLWNVLKGDMTLVGPRPPTLNEVPAYSRWQRRRLSMTGGITCIWQVSGRSTIGFEDWMRMDVRYTQKRNPWLDLSLLARTATAVISGRGAY